MDTVARAKSLRFTAMAVAASFTNMLFVLIALGVPWHTYYGSVQATLLYFVSRNVGGYRDAGDPAFGLLFVGGVFHNLAVYALYNRWAARTSRFPHSAKACVILFSAAALFIFLSFCVYSGIINKQKLANPGHVEAGFGLAVWIFVANTITAVALWRSRDEIDGVDPGSQEQAMPYADLAGTKNPFHPENFKAKFSKSKVHSSAVAVAILDLLFVIMSLGLPWRQEDGHNSYGLVQSFSRLPSSGIGSELRAAGDPAFAFTFLSFLAQIHATAAITLRFLGRNDGFSSKVPHSLRACVVSTSLSCVCSFLAFVIYAGVYNDKKNSTSTGNFEGGFALEILVWILSMSVLAVLILKRKEVDEAPAPSPSAAGLPSSPMSPNPLAAPPSGFDGGFSPAPYSAPPSFSAPPAPYPQEYPPVVYVADPVVVAEPEDGAKVV